MILILNQPTAVMNRHTLLTTTIITATSAMAIFLLLKGDLNMTMILMTIMFWIMNLQGLQKRL
jgi:hypothetical protein